MVIYLDELSHQEIPEVLEELRGVNSLTILRTKETKTWTVHPPLSWYETRELKEPFFTLPASIGELHALRSLHLANLDIRGLPESIVKLKNLQFLDISMNKLELTKELPKLSKLPNLKTLRVLGNHFDPNKMQEFQRQNPTIEVVYKDEKQPQQ